VAYPVMGAKWGFNKSAAALMKASNEAVRGKNDITKSLTPEELRAFEKAVRDGTIDVTQAHDLAGIAQGEDSKVMWKIRPVMRLASYMFHQAEVFN
ncbi:PLxRFG domain-containing protein, partial [Escherichia coli]